MRRHLNASQRAMIAAELATMRSGARTDLAPNDARSDAQAAELLNVSERSVERAKAVRREAIPEVAEAVKAGDLSVAAALKLANLSVGRPAGSWPAASDFRPPRAGMGP